MGHPSPSCRETDRVVNDGRLGTWIQSLGVAFLSRLLAPAFAIISDAPAHTYSLSLDEFIFPSLPLSLRLVYISFVRGWASTEISRRANARTPPALFPPPFRSVENRKEGERERVRKKKWGKGKYSKAFESSWPQNDSRCCAAACAGLFSPSLRAYSIELELFVRARERLQRPSQTSAGRRRPTART